MLNHNTESKPCRSSRALKIRCAMYPPPPGSDPGYQNAHHCTPRYTQNVITGNVQSVSLAKPCEKSGRNASGSEPPFLTRRAAIWLIIELMPPVAFTAYQAMAMT